MKSEIRAKGTKTKFYRELKSGRFSQVTFSIKCLLSSVHYRFFSIPSGSFLSLEVFWALALAQAHTGAAAVFVDEFDAGFFEGA